MRGVVRAPEFEIACLDGTPLGLLAVMLAREDAAGSARSR
jgi:hypothetical protein